MSHRIILVSIFLSIVTGISGQDIFRRFSTDTVSYPEELLRFMGVETVESAPEVVSLMAQKWGEGSIPDTNKVEIIRISNNLLEKYARPRPHYLTFLEVLHLFDSNPRNAENQRRWIESMLDFTTSSGLTLPAIQDYMMSTRLLLESGTISQTNSTRWKSSSLEFRLEYDDSVSIYLDRTNLTCYAVRDSIMIHQTGGVYNPITHKWTGKEGKITWDRSGYDPERVYSDFDSYQINLRTSDFNIENVRFYHTDLFDFAIPGGLQHKAERIISETKANYPKFQSYEMNYVVDGIYDNVEYNGGISMNGSMIIGTGSLDRKASMKFLKRDTLVIVARSEAFYFDRVKLSSMNAEVSLYIESDSIYHPSTGMEYFDADRRISFFRTGSFQSESPYHNSYHHVEMNFEQLSWNLEDDLILFKMKEGSAEGLANFQSDNLFDERTFYRIQGIDEENILNTLRRYSEKVFDITFRADDFSRYARIRYAQMQQILKRLAVLGFINYDLERELITLRQKLYDWIYASVNSIDYDVIDLVSETTSPLENASLDLTNNDLQINGLKMIRLSHAQSVYLYPENQTITMKRDRDFSFNGTIDAGLFTVFGKNFFFDYDEFRINLTDIDSLSLRVKGDEVDAYGQASLQAIQSLIQDMSGELLIDHPENKSGRRNYPSYPVFRSYENSFVYYDDETIQNGVYTKDDFYFEVFPFIFDSLDNYSKAGLDLNGILHSADIFPDIEFHIYVQPDKSLGFKYVTDSSGLDLYRGKGHFQNEIRLSNAGLRGGGDFTYLTSLSKSDDIVFHPDSLMCNAREFDIRQQMTGIQYPMVEGGENDLQWYPYHDTMLVDKGTRPFTIMNDSTLLDGSLVLTPMGLAGKGRMDLTNSVLESNLFTYTAMIFDSDTADFRLKSINTDGFTLVTDNVRAHVDFEDRSGIFQTNEEYSLVEFPENKYVSRLDLFTWDMDEALLAMGSATASDTLPDVMIGDDGEERLVGPRYISVDPDQDSLSFVSNKAVYDYQRNILRGSYVTFLRVADAYIYPGDGEVIINPDGVMREFLDSKIIANRQSRMHEFYEATVNVIGRNEYTGAGSYDYINAVPDTQLIVFHNIEVDDSINTIAEGMIGEHMDFTLSPQYSYQGRAELHAKNRFLTFDGGARILYDCPDNENNFLKFKAEIDPENIYIPIPEQALDINMNYIYSGIYIANDSAHIYPAFNGNRKLTSDRAIVSSMGYLHYDDRNSGISHCFKRETGAT